MVTLAVNSQLNGGDVMNTKVNVLLNVLKEKGYDIKDFSFLLSEKTKK